MEFAVVANQIIKIIGHLPCHEGMTANQRWIQMDTDVLKCSAGVGDGGIHPIALYVIYGISSIRSREL